jgi:hypothetical protein
MRHCICLFGFAAYRGRVTVRRGCRKPFTASDFVFYAGRWIRTSENSFSRQLGE